MTITKLRSTPTTRPRVLGSMPGGFDDVIDDVISRHHQELQRSRHYHSPTPSRTASSNDVVRDDVIDQWRLDVAEQSRYKSPLVLKNAGLVLDRRYPESGRVSTDRELRTQDRIWRHLEEGFVNDAVETDKYHYPRKIPIIPQYDALVDPATGGYFKSPQVMNVLEITMDSSSSDLGGRCSRSCSSQSNSTRTFPPGDKKNQRPSLNKLSTRRLCPPSPPAGELAKREADYVNDAILAEKLRTKYHDTLLPPYSAQEDVHCQGYFSRADVQRQLQEVQRGKSPTTSLHSPTRSKRCSSGGVARRTRSVDQQEKSGSGTDYEIEGGIRLKSCSSQTHLSVDPRATTRASDALLALTGTGSPSIPPRHRSPSVRSRSSLSSASFRRVRRPPGMHASRTARAEEELRESKQRLPEVPLAEKPSSYIMRSLNKMSTRGRCIPTPPPEVLTSREERFINDGVPTERQRTKYRDTVLPKYDGVNDVHCKAYFRRADIQKLITVTKTLKPVSSKVSETCICEQ